MSVYLFDSAKEFPSTNHVIGERPTGFLIVSVMEIELIMFCE